MPRKYKSKYPKRRRLARRKAKIYRVPMTADNRKVVKLRYADLITLNGTVNTPANRVYKLNSPYDPDHTGVGSQPAGFDQWMALYNKCTVIGAKIKLTALSTNSSSITGRAVFGMYMRNNASVAGTVNDALVKSRATWRALSAIGGGPATGFTMLKWSARKFWGIPRKDSLIGRSEYNCTASADPNTIAYLVAFACGPNESADPDPVDMMITIDYICVFTEPKSQIES